MAPLDAQLNVVINTSQATAQLRSLQGSIDSINRSFIATGSTAVAQQAKINSQLLDSAKASGMWTARIVPMTTAMNQFSDSLDRGKMTLGEYTRYATSAMPGMSRVFRKEFDMMTRVAEDRVKRMQTQFVNLGTSANGVGKALALTPTALDQYASSAAVATQRQMMMNRMIDLGSTKLLNWGKNTQWAGRQLMVGFSIPLAMMGAAAAKAFKEIDQSSIAFRRVYGDLQTTTAEMENNLEAVKALGMEYTKYGQSLAETIDLAAKVAATGAENETLMAATEQTIRLATLGMMEYNEAMDATIALQTAFGVSNEDLAQTIDFLNVVENQTVLSMQDMAAAIPRVAPVVRGLGGDVKDLAVFMTAMREGGISAEQGANALKSGLGRLINPTKAAKEMLAEFGININAILQRNKGDLMGMVKEFGDALSTLGEFEQQQVLQKVFGTYQYARLGALFKNIANDAGQAQRTMELTAMSVEDLAKISERELGRIEEATSVKFAAALEKLKVAIAPLGEMFMKILMPIIDRVAKVADAFNNLPDGIKNAIGIAVTAIAGIAPVLIMITGLFGNAIANSIKFVQFMRKGFARIKGNAAAFDNLTMQELEAKTAADALSGSTDILTGKFLGQQRALIGLTGLLERYKAGLMSIPGVIPGAGGKGGGGKPGNAPLPFAKGGLVPGRGNKDSIPALLTPGESVVTKEATKQYAPILEAMNRGKLPGFNRGTVPSAVPSPADAPYKAPQSVKKVASQQPEYANMPENTAKLIAGLKLRGKIPDNVLASMLRTDVAHRYEDVRKGKKFWDQRNLFNAPGAENLGFQNITTNKAYMNILRYLAGGNRMFSTIFVGKKHPTSPNELRYASSLIKRAQTFVNNNPDDPDVIAFKNTKTYQNSWDIIAGAIFSARASKKNKDFPLAAPLYGGRFIRPKGMAQGGIVPGQGNRDTVPALLTPGESVITKEATSKFGPILEAMNRGTVRGFAEAEVGIDAPQTMRGSGAHYTRAKIVTDTEEIRRIIENNIEQAQLVGRSTKEFQTALDELNAGARMQATLFTNAISNIPEIANMDEMTGTEFGRMLADQGNREKMMKPFIEQFAKELGTDAATLRNNPNFIRSVNSIAEEVGTTLAQRGGEFVNTSEFNDAFNAAIDRKITSGEFSPAEAEAARNLRTRKTRVSILADGKEIVSRAPIYGAGVTAYGRGAQESFGTEFLTEEGNAKRRARAEARAARRLAYGQSQRTGATAGGAAIPIPNRSDIRQLLEESGLGPAARATQRAESERAATEKARQREIRRQEIISGRRLTQPLGPRVTPQAGPQSSRVVDLGMPGMREGIAAQEETTKRFGKLSQALSKVSSHGMGVSFALMGLTSAASFAGGSIGEMAQKLMPVVGVLSTIPMMLNPVGLAIVAITALVGSLYLMRKSVDETARSAAEAGANMGGAANRMEILQEAIGFESPFMRAKDRMFRFNEKDLEAMSQFQTYFESEGGSKFITELKSLSSQERYAKISSIIAQGIANGLDPEKAKAFGQAVASQINDAMLNAKLLSDFSRGIFRSGSQAAIDLVRERQAASATEIIAAPNIATSPISTALGTSGATNIWGEAAAAVGAGAGAGALIGGGIGSAGFALGPLGAITAPVGAAVGAIIGTIATGIPVFFKAKNALDELNKNVETVAKTFGSSIQIMKEVVNAEQLLLEERRSGAISSEEYAKRSTELQAIEEEQANRLRQAIIMSTDEGATQQSIADQLMISTGMDQGLAGAVARGVSREDVSQKIFGEAWKDLTTQQQEVVSAAITETLKGITPENAAEKLSRIESDYALIAEQLVAAAADGLTQQEFTQLAESKQVENWAKSAFGDIDKATAEGLGFRGRKGATAQQSLAMGISSNLMQSKRTFEDLGLTINEVTVALQGLSNINLAAEIGADKDKLANFSKLLIGLEGFNGIKIENAFKYMSQQGLTTEQTINGIKKSVNDIAKIQLSKKIFGNTKLDAQALTQQLMDLGIPFEQIPNKVADGVKKATAIISGLGKEARTKLGNIKITADLVYKMFGNDVQNAEGIMEYLKNAYPKELPASVIPIMLSLMNPEMLQALAGISPQMADFMRKNPNATSYTTGAGTSFATTRNISSVERQAFNAAEFASSQASADIAAANQPKTPSGGAGASSFLQNLKKEIEANLKIFVKDISGGSMAAVQKLRALKIPEQLIEAMGAGPEGYKNMKEFLGQGAQQRKKLISDYFKSLAGKQISALVGQKRIDQATEKSAGRLRAEGFNSERIGDILSNPEVAQTLAALKVGSPEWERYINKLKAAEQQSKATAMAIDPVGEALKQLEETMQPVFDEFDRKEALFEQAFGQLERQYQPLIQASQKRVQGIEDEINAVQREIDAIQELNDADQQRVRGLERQKEMLSRQLEILERQNEQDERSINALRREDEIRNRVSDALSHDLEILSQQEDKIRQDYEDRISALENVAKLNDQILQSQQDQLNVAQALSTGDIYAATAAAQQMRQNQTQFAIEQSRAGMQQGMENAIESLTTPGGLTRAQAEEQIRIIKEQSYQTSLLIRDIEDRIYERNQQMVPIKDQQRVIDDQIRVIQDIIYDRESKILDIQNNRLGPLNKRLEAEQQVLTNNEKALADAKAQVQIDGLTYEQLQNQISAQKESYNVAVASIKTNIEMTKSVDNVRKKWVDVSNQIAAAVRTAKQLSEQAQIAAQSDIAAIQADAYSGLITADTAQQKIAAVTQATNQKLGQIINERTAGINAALASGTAAISGMGMYAGGMVPRNYAVGGNVIGSGTRDSVAARLSPGEFVVRRAMVDKYGSPMLNAINQGAFAEIKQPKFNFRQPNMPRFRMPNKREENIQIQKDREMYQQTISPVYNDSYNLNVSINNPNANAEQIAEVVMMRIKQLQNMQIRGNRGY